MHRALDSLAVFVAAFALYVLLAQRTVYGVDGWVLLRRLSGGDVRSDMHLAFKPLAYLGVRIGESLGLSLYDAAVATCGFCAAAGVALVHAAARVLDVRRRDAFLVAAGIGLTPGVSFFATVMERHGVFFLGVGLAAMATAGFVRRPGPGRALWMALAIVLAYALHSTGVFLTAIDLPLAVVLARQFHPRQPWPRLLRLASLALVASAVGCVLARKLALWAGVVEHEGASFAFFLAHAKFHLGHPEMIAGALLQELLLPFLPFSVAWLAALRLREHRPAVAATAIGVLAYGALSYLMLGDFGERGAYCLPLALPFVGLSRLALGLRWFLPATALALVLTIVQIQRHDDRQLRPVADGVHAIGGERVFLLPAASTDFELIYLYFPELRPNDDFWDGFDAKLFPSATVRDNAAILTGYLGSKLGSGRVLLMSVAGRAELEKPVDPGQAGALVLEVLEQRFRFEPVHAAGFEGFRLLPRQ